MYNLNELKELAKPIQDWLYKNGNPHMIIQIDQAGAELLSGELYAPNDYIKY